MSRLIIIIIIISVTRQSQATGYAALATKQKEQNAISSKDKGNVKRRQ
jgi:hypothetical protein